MCSFSKGLGKINFRIKINFKNSLNEFYNYPTFIDILQFWCGYTLQVLVWKKHFDFRLDTARLDKTEYTEEMKVDDEGKKFLSF